jgi:GH25 family lysozyme M1 (1,4-beta-N-acetylmuramidase)
MIRFIDVSSAQSAGTDWDKVFASGVRAVWIKASEGRKGRDPRFAAHRAGASLAGLRCGAYGFCRPNTGFAGETLEIDARAEAELFFDASGGLGSTTESLPPLVDLESAPKDMTLDALMTWLRAYLERATALWGVIPWIYTGSGFTSRWPAWGQQSWLAAYPLVIAAYPNPGGKPITPEAAALREPPSLAPWGKPIAWQSSGGGPGMPGLRVPGFGNVPIDCGLIYLNSLDDALVTAPRAPNAAPRPKNS